MVQTLNQEHPPTTPLTTSRDNHLWLKLWRKKMQDGFHQKEVNSLLTRFWPELDLAPRSRVFVPLCGKSLDMIWLAQQGHEVVGVELSPIAVEAFFWENRLTPLKRKVGELTLWQCDRISIWCGDYFALTTEMLGTIDVVYDRAALTALPEDLRELYVQKLQQVVPKHAGIFLLTTEDGEVDSSELQDSPVDQELVLLYSSGFDIRQVHVERLMERNPETPKKSAQPVEYKVYKLTNK